MNETGIKSFTRGSCGELYVVASLMILIGIRVQLRCETKLVEEMNLTRWSRLDDLTASEFFST